MMQYEVQPWPWLRPRRYELREDALVRTSPGRERELPLGEIDRVRILSAPGTKLHVQVRSRSRTKLALSSQHWNGWRVCHRMEGLAPLLEALHARLRREQGPVLFESGARSQRVLMYGPLVLWTALTVPFWTAELWRGEWLWPMFMIPLTLFVVDSMLENGRERYGALPYDPEELRFERQDPILATPSGGGEHPS